MQVWLTALVFEHACHAFTQCLFNARGDVTVQSHLREALHQVS